MTQSLRIQRGDAEDACYAIYEVDLEPGATLLDALECIRTGAVPDLMYRHSCHHGSCGTCAVRVDGKEMLACLTRLDTLAGRTPTIEPLAAFKPEKDLAVDPGTLFRALPKNTTHIRSSEWAGGEISLRVADDTPHGLPRGIEQYVRFEDCIECGACISACPVMKNSRNNADVQVAPFVGPAVLAAVHLESINRPSRAGEMLKLARQPNAVPACEKHFDCSRVCPRMVYPGKHITELRRELERQQK